MAALQELEDIIRKETYHVVPIMESRQGFTNLTATVQRIGQVAAVVVVSPMAGREAVDWARSCLRDHADARAAADKALAVQQALEEDVLALQAKLREEERLTAEARADADASQGREQTTLVLLEELRAELQRQRTRAEHLSTLQEPAAPGAGEDIKSELDAHRRLVREQDLAEELTHVKELLRSTYDHQDAIARRASFANMRANKLTEELTSAQAAHALEVRHKENVERDAQQLRRDLEARAAESEEEGRAQLQVAELELGRQRRQLAALEKAHDAAASRLRSHDAKLAALVAERDALLANRADLRRELEARVLRSKQKLWDDLSREYALCRKKARQDETARERLRQEKQQLASSLADKNLRMDGVRSQLGMAVRELTEQRERHQEAVAQVHALDKSNEQLKEEAATREKQAVQLERLLARSRTEAHGLRADAQRLEAAVKALRAQAAALAAEERRLNDLLREADAERTELRREAESRLDERDVIATMLVRRNDEVLLLREKGRLLQDALVRGRAALLAAREDSRLLALEVRRLRAERRHLAAQVQNTPGLRAQLYRALQDLTRDQVRLRALEDEMSCPLNVHRWRKLEGVDPPAFELLLKARGLHPQVRILQKRVLHLSAAGLRREAQLRHTEGLYVALRRAVCPTEGLPGPIGVPRHTRLASRGRHLKALIAEVSALEALADQKTATRLLADLRCSELHLPDLDLRKRKAPDEGREEPEEAPRAKQPSPRPAGNVTLSGA
ncbi:hypothetical protein FOCC_FOCC017708 [Frankliniella occidentalis]|nr:hypothetical protein FOCC_FOCC017708 [Frankliniella occidentalis]